MKDLTCSDADVLIAELGERARDAATVLAEASAERKHAALIGAAGLSSAALAPNAPIAILAWGLFGIGLAGCVPQFFSAAGNVDATASGTYLARVAGFGYVGLLAGPAIIGILTDWIPLTTAFIVPIVCCLAGGLLAPGALRSRP